MFTSIAPPSLNTFPFKRKSFQISFTHDTKIQKSKEKNRQSNR